MTPINHEPNPNNQVPPTLPDWCYTVLPSSGALIIVERDVNGYGKLPESSDDPQLNRKLATEYNTRMGYTPTGSRHAGRIDVRLGDTCCKADQL